MVPDTERHEELLQTLDTAARQSPWPAWVWCDLLPGGLMLNHAARQWLGLHGVVDQPLMAQALSGRQPQTAPLPWLASSNAGHLGAQEWPDGELTWLRLPPAGPQGWYVRLWPRAELPAPTPLPPREDRFRLIIESALTHSVNGVVVTDATLPGNPIVHVTPGFTRLTGYSANEVIGLNCGFLQGPDRAQAGVFKLREAIAHQRDCTVVLRNFRKDGTPFWNQVEMHPVRDEATGLVTHFFALQTDVTLRKEAEEAALMRHIELERVFAGSPMALLTLDAQQCVQMASPAFERLFGTRLDAIKGCPRDELPQRLPLLAGEPSAGPPPTSSTAQSPWPWPDTGHSECWHVGGPSPRALEVSVHPLGGPSPERLYLFRDVTQAEEQQQAHSEFLAKAAHELRTPLGSICGFTELLLSRAYTREQQRPLLETVLSQAMRLTSLINDLLDLSRMDHLGEQAFPLRAVDLRGVMHKALQVVQTPGGGRSFDVQWPPAGPLVWGHAQKLEQVLINLLSNAVKYSPDGGAVHVRALPDPIPGSWRIEVEDHGIGLSPEHLDKLFTRFFRANPSGPIPGTGLGLVIVKELVERMGGQVTVRSTLGQGTTFSVHLSPLPDVAPASSSSS